MNNQPTIPEVTNLHTGEILNSIDFFKMDEDSTFKFRIENEENIQKGKKFLVCSLCNQPVKIRGNPKGLKALHFSHLHSSGDCPIKTGQSYTKEEINAMKYNGVKESEEHKKLKGFIYKMLKNDNSFKNTQEETVIKNQGLQKTWKKPDVSTTFNNKNIVFEIQLSTTFLDVIVSRQNFYYSNDTNIIWIFNKFYQDLSKLKFTEKDILYSNKNNVFVLDEEMINISIQSGILSLKAYFLKPLRNKNGDIEYQWEAKRVPVTNIIFDNITNKSYVYNFDSEKAKLLFKEKLEKRPLFNMIKTAIKQVEAVEGGQRYDWNLSNVMDTSIFDYFDLFTLDELIDAEEIINFILTILYYGSAEEKSFEARYRDDKKGYYIRLLNHIIDYRKDYMYIILKALDYYNRRDMIEKHDKKGKFQERLKSFKKESPPQNYKHDKVLQYLFPELFYNSAIPQ